MATPCCGVEWWQRWQETLLWLPPIQSENSGLDRWQVAQSRGSSSTKRLKRRNAATPPTAARATTGEQCSRSRAGEAHAVDRYPTCTPHGARDS